MKNKIIIFGNGEIADLAHFYFSNDSEYNVVAFSCDDKFVKDNLHCGLPLVPLSQLTKEFPSDDYKAHVALSYNKLNQVRAEKYSLMKSMGYDLVSYICSKSVVWSDLSIGDNCFILENQTIQPTVLIGNNVMIWSGNHLGHGCSIGDHTYLSSHICISGHTVIGEKCFVGVNSTFKDFINIGDSVFIAMDASVTKDIPDNAVVAGSPATVFKADDQIAIKLKKKYFNI